MNFYFLFLKEVVSFCYQKKIKATYNDDIVADDNDDDGNNQDDLLKVCEALLKFIDSAGKLGTQLLSSSM